MEVLNSNITRRTVIEPRKITWFRSLWLKFQIILCLLKYPQVGFCSPLISIKVTDDNKDVESENDQTDQTNENQSITRHFDFKQ